MHNEPGQGGCLPPAQWNDTARDFSKGRCIHELFEEQVERSPEAIAVIAGDRHLTYRQLNERSNRVAHFLLGRGIGPDRLVGLFVERSLDMAAALLGILKAGGAYLPVDPSYPDARIRHILEQAESAMLLTQQSLGARLSAIAAAIPAVIFENEDLSRFSTENPRTSISSQNLAYVMYTSGSTGGPKGVGIPHSAVNRLVKNTNFAQLDAGKCLLSAAPIAFDASTLEIWGALLNGGRVVLMTERIPTPQAIAALAARHAIDIAWLTSSLFNSIIDIAPESLRGIRQLLVGGEALSVRHIAEANRVLPDTALTNGYGPTESTTFTCTYAIPKSFDETAGNSVPIGRPIANTTVHILDESLEPVRVGEIGELFIGGEGLARCYVNRPDLTAERFIPNPFGEGSRLYRTGDQVRYLSDGNIEFAGRVDDQVKIRGFRIELGEIEAALGQHPDVLQSAVIVREDAPGAKRLVGYVVPREESAVTGRELRTHLSRSLPEYMVPAQVVILSEMPLSPTGKTDRHALPIPASAEAESIAKTEMEAALMGVCRDVLKLSAPSLDATFTEQGGSSLDALRMIAALRERASIELPLRLLLGSGTLQEIAAELERDQGSAEHGRARFEKLPRDGGPLPTSHPQERVWFVQRMDPDNLAYQFTATLRFTGRLDAAALASALTRIVARHEIYRTSFRNVEGRLRQVIHDPWPVELPIVDAAERPLEDVIHAQSHQPFDLGALPLVRWTLWRGSETEHVLVMVEHHIVHDGWSFNVFQKELTEHYRALTEGSVPRVHPEPLQYADFAQWQRRWMEGEEARRQLDFWSSKLAGVPPLLIQDRPRPAMQTYNGACPRIEIGETLFETVTAAARETQSTVFMLFTVAFQLLLYRASGQEDFCIGTGIANRRWPETDDLMGMVVNNIGLRLETRADLTVGELLEQAKAVALEAYANQDVPFDQVVQAVRPPRDLSHNPIYQVMLSFHDSPLECASLAGLAVEVEPGLSNGAAKFDLNIVVVAPQKHQPRARLLWEYNTDLFEAATIERMVADYLRLLEQVAAADPRTRVADLFSGSVTLRKFEPRVASHGTAAAARPKAMDLTASAGAVEEIVAGIWKTVLHLERVGRFDDFFELGGHSLLAMQVISRIHSALSIDLPVRALFEAPTVAELADRIERATRSRIPALVRQERREPPPLSFAQQRLWFLQQLDPAGFQYNVRVYLRLTGAVDESALDRALREIVRRHEVLRTTLKMDGPVPLQVVGQVPETILSRVDVGGEQQLRALMAEEARQPFDLERGPLLRAVLVRIGREHCALLITMHHIVCDGWSLDVFARELSALYAGVSLPDPPVQYADYAVWQREWMRDEVLETQLAYWRGQLADVAVLDLPAVRPRPAIPSHAGTRRPFAISSDVVESLRELGRQEGVTLFMTLLAACNILLSRYTSQRDIAVGTPIAGRNAKETEGLIGFFVNTLVMRTDLSGAPTVRELLGRVREVALGAYGNQDVPFEKLVDELQPGRDMSRTPLFQVMFALQNAHETAWELPGVGVSKEAVATESEKFPLSLIFEESASGLSGAVGYQTDVFDEPMIARLTGHLERLLASMSSDPGIRIDALPLLGEDEAKEIVETWNDTAHEAPRGTTIHQRFEEQVRKTPDRLAVIDETRQLTFRELNRCANRLAHHLRGQGVARESAVGLCADRSVEMIVGILGILKAGGAYVPLDPHTPSERSRFVIEDAAIRVVLTKEEIDAIALREDDLAAFDVDVDSGVDEAGLAYVIFTSGSTGRPKGVAIAHRSVLNLEMALRGQIPAARGRVGVNAPIAFDASVKQWIQLLNGATLVLVPEAVRQSPGQFLSFIETRALDLIDCTPSHLQVLVEQGLLDSPVATTFLVGGETIAEPLWRRLAESRTARFYNVYGPTECTVDAALAPVAIDSAGVVIGRPLWNVTLYVLDDAMRPVPAGVRGELYVGGVGLARGYAGRPDWTAERFVPNPFAAAGGERLYRTGDAVRWRADGQLEYLERIDQQVKVRGYRIELGEIEAVIARHPRVAQAVVLVHEDRLIAYVTGSAGPDELRAHVVGRLPDFMVPSAFVPLEQFPTTVNGKVDRRKLLSIDAGPFASAAGYVAPRSAIELLVADITADVLGVDRVGVLDDFFALGGHSLLAMQLVSRISRILKTEVPLRFVFLAPTVAGMAEVLMANPNIDSVRRIAESYQRMHEADAGEPQLAEEGARS